MLSIYLSMPKYKQLVKILSDATQQNVLQEIYYQTRQIVLSMWANFASIQFVACAFRIALLSNWSPRVQILCEICTHFGRYLYSTKCRWIIITITRLTRVIFELT